MELEKNNLNKKYLYFLSVISLTVLSVLLLFFLAIRPLYNSNKSFSAELKSKKENLTYLEDKKSKLDGLKSREAELNEDAKKVAAALPTEKDAGRIFIQFDQIANSVGAKLTSVSEAGSGSSAGSTTSTTTTNVGAGLTKISYSAPITLPGYSNFIDILNRAEGALRIFKIDNINLSADQSGANMTTNLQVSTFVRSSQPATNQQGVSSEE